MDSSSWRSIDSVLSARWLAVSVGRAVTESMIMAWVLVCVNWSVQTWGGGYAHGWRRGFDSTLQTQRSNSSEPPKLSCAIVSTIKPIHNLNVWSLNGEAHTKTIFWSKNDKWLTHLPAAQEEIIWVSWIFLCTKVINMEIQHNREEEMKCLLQYENNLYK